MSVLETSMIFITGYALGVIVHGIFSVSRYQRTIAKQSAEIVKNTHKIYDKLHDIQLDIENS